MNFKRKLKICWHALCGDSIISGFEITGQTNIISKSDAYLADNTFSERVKINGIPAIEFDIFKKKKDEESNATT